MDKDQIAAIERQMLEEHKRDMEALARLKRFIPSNGNGSGAATTQLQMPIAPLVPEADAPLRTAIRDIMNHDPNAKWTNAKMLKYLRDIKYELQALRPIYSIGQATQKLAARGDIKLVRQGAGNVPNIYRGLTQLEQAAKENSPDDEA